MLGVYLIVLSVITTSTNGIKYYLAHECANCAEITEIDGKNIECNGYRSCFNTSNIILSGHEANNATINCKGSHSCFKSSNVINTRTSGSIWCDGLFSCGLIKNLTNNDGMVVCSGELSCSSSNLTVISGNDSTIGLICDGVRSCANSDIYADSAYIAGNLGAQNATFHTRFPDGTSVPLPDQILQYTFYFVGPESGHGATIVCGISDICGIVCYGTGCNNITIECVNSACIIYKYCVYSVKNDFCPNVTNTFDKNLVLSSMQSVLSIESLKRLQSMHSNIIQPSLADLAMSNDQDSILSCTNNNYSDTSQICDDTYECATWDILSTSVNNPGSICCLSLIGCIYIDNMTSVSSLNNGNNNDNDVAIRCDGSWSCVNGSMTANVGDIYITGWGAAYNKDKVILNHNYHINSNNTNSNAPREYNIYCTSMHACWGINMISNGNNLFCNSRFSCQNVGIISQFNFVWFYARESGNYSTIDTIYYNVYCADVYSCSQTRINNVYENVFATCALALTQSNVSNVGYFVFAFGTFAAWSSTFTNVTNVLCIGDYSCSQTTMFGVENVFASGNRSLLYATVYSSGELNMTINSTYNDGLKIFCMTNDTCFIECNQATSCRNVTMYFMQHSTFRFSCGNDIECPDFEIISQMPTNITTIPTMMHMTTRTSLTPTIATVPTNEMTQPPTQTTTQTTTVQENGTIQGTDGHGQVTTSDTTMSGIETTEKSKENDDNVVVEQETLDFLFDNNRSNENTNTNLNGNNTLIFVELFDDTANEWIKNESRYLDSFRLVNFRFTLELQLNLLSNHNGSIFVNSDYIYNQTALANKLKKCEIKWQQILSLLLNISITRQSFYIDAYLVINSSDAFDSNDYNYRSNNVNKNKNKNNKDDSDEDLTVQVDVVILDGSGKNQTSRININNNTLDLIKQSLDDLVNVTSIIFGIDNEDVSMDNVIISTIDVKNNDVNYDGDIPNVSGDDTDNFDDGDDNDIDNALTPEAIALLTMIGILLCFASICVWCSISYCCQRNSNSKSNVKDLKNVTHYLPSEAASDIQVYGDSENIKSNNINKISMNNDINGLGLDQLQISDQSRENDYSFESGQVSAISGVSISTKSGISRPPRLQSYPSSSSRMQSTLAMQQNYSINKMLANQYSNYNNCGHNDASSNNLSPIWNVGDVFGPASNQAVD